MSKQPLSLYIHIPFCNRRCDYCHFYVVTGLEKLIPTYVATLKNEVELISKSLNSFEISTVYFGGGTPSLLAGEQVLEIMNSIKAQFSLAKNLEITLEANPENINLNNLKDYLAAGVNRLSLGLQAGQNNQLKSMGRSYTVSDFQFAADLVKKTGFKNLNLDLIFGLPNQSLADWEEALTLALAQNPQHLSCYSLELDHQSVFGQKYRRHQLFPASDKLNREFYQLAKTKLAAAGFNHYEISNWALPEFECQHNLNFWKNQPYIGIGAGAHSFLQNQTWQNPPIIAKYLATLANNILVKSELNQISPEDLEIEATVLNLRLTAGLNIPEFQAAHNFDPAQKFRLEWEQLEKQNLILKSPQNIQLTQQGRDFYDQIASLLWQQTKI